VVKYSDDKLDAVFAALSDPTRRNVLELLSRNGSVTVMELAEPHGMSLPGFMKHLRVLEDAGLVARTKEGRVVHCTLETEPLQEAAAWLARYHKFWTEQLDSLARYLYRQKELRPWQEATAKGGRRSLSRAATRRRPNKSGARGKQWWRPDETFSTPVVEADVRVDGRFRVVMKDAKGEEFEVSGVYREVIPNRKLVFTWAWKGTPERESLVTVSLRPSGHGTELKLKHEQFFDDEARDSHEEGWRGALEQLERALA